MITPDLKKIIKKYSDKINPKAKNIGLIMAGGHGKRIKSSLPKVVHLVWGQPSVTRVLTAFSQGIRDDNQIVIVGRKAEEVIPMIGFRKNRIFVYQEEQMGTGHAVQQGLKVIPKSYKGNLYVLPGDVGLIDDKTLLFLKNKFEKNTFGMMMLTGIYQGIIKNNYYGRIIRLPDKDAYGQAIPKEEQGQVIAISQYQDILLMSYQEKKYFSYQGKNYFFNKETLLNIREFDSGIFVFDFQSLAKHIYKLSSKNSQNEFYLTDLVEYYNQDKIKIGSITPPRDHEVLIGFNNKSVLRNIENIYRSRCFEKIKNIINIEDHQRFFIDDKIVSQIINKDKKGYPLDIHIGSGVYLKGKINISSKVFIGYKSYLEGNIEIKEGVQIGENVHISNWENQKIVIEKDVHLVGDIIIKGNIVIKKNSIIGRNVNLTGNNDYPTIIGTNSKIWGTSYLFGCILEKNSQVETSILIKKKVNCNPKKNSKNIQKVCFVIPKPQGEKAIKDL
jgi:bifunctional UDP-N-acetylglucosamine pyrophosphorylase/glucosamine-1-phosphate N-acetyltransferase